MDSPKDSYCSRCFKPASLMCRRCFQVYCSTRCQATDWAVHKTVCIEMPTLAPLESVVASTSKRDSVQSRLQVAKMQIPESNGDIVPKTMQQSSEQVRDCEMRSLDRTQQRRISLNMSKDEERPKLTSIRDRMDVFEWQEHILPPMRDQFLAVVQFVDQDPTVLWISDAKYTKQIGDLHTDMLNNLAPNYRCNDDDIAVGKLVIVDSGCKVAYRAEILKVFPERQIAYLRFIDFGSLERTGYENLYKPSPAALNSNAFAFRIRTNQVWSVNDMDTIIGVRILSDRTPANYYMAEVQKKSELNQNVDCAKHSKVALESHLSHPIVEGTFLSASLHQLADANGPMPTSARMPVAATNVKSATNLTMEQFGMGGGQSTKNSDDGAKPPTKIVDNEVKARNVEENVAAAKPMQMQMPKENVEAKPKKIDNARAVETVVKKCALMDLVKLPLLTGSNRILILLDKSLLSSEGYITVCDADNAEINFLQENLKKVATYCEGESEHKASGYMPKCGDLCLAIFDIDAQWYRAVCLHVFDGGFYQIQFIDYGNKAMVKSDNIMPMPKELMFSTIANHCHVIESLQNQVKNVVGNIKGTVEKRGDLFYLVNIN